MTAAQLGCVDMVRMLLELGVPINVPDLSGWTALHAASEAGQTEVVELLLKHGVGNDIIIIIALCILVAVNTLVVW